MVILVHKKKDHPFEKRCTLLKETTTFITFGKVYLLSWKGYINYRHTIGPFPIWEKHWILHYITLYDKKESFLL